jgi:GntR family transcriptional regulator, transcriptional repressor for pyruvate dehydrogenase complex
MAETSDLTLSRVPRQKLAEAVAEQLLDAIKDLEPGTRIPSERELTKQLEVGRSTVREALNGLALLGHIEIRHGQGAFVIDRPELSNEPGALEAALVRGVTRDFIEARLAVEIAVARLAAQRRTEEDLERMVEVLAEQELLLEGEVDELVDVAANFNVVLAEAAHNEVFVALVQSFVGMMVDRGPRIYALDGFRAWDLGEHHGIYAAVREQDVNLAGELMRLHIEALAQYYRRAGAG